MNFFWLLNGRFLGIIEVLGVLITSCQRENWESQFMAYLSKHINFWKTVKLHPTEFSQNRCDKSLNFSVIMMRIGLIKYKKLIEIYTKEWQINRVYFWNSNWYSSRYLLIIMIRILNASILAFFSNFNSFSRNLWREINLFFCDSDKEIFYRIRRFLGVTVYLINWFWSNVFSTLDVIIFL